MEAVCLLRKVILACPRPRGWRHSLRQALLLSVAQPRQTSPCTVLWLVGAWLQIACWYVLVFWTVSCTCWLYRTVCLCSLSRYCRVTWELI